MSAGTILIRDARADDAAEILDIYRPFVIETAVSFEESAPTLDEIEARIAAAQTKWAWLVAQADGRVAGYAYASAFRARGLPLRRGDVRLCSS